jgi:hypothetical protein
MIHIHVNIHSSAPTATAGSRFPNSKLKKVNPLSRFSTENLGPVSAKNHPAPGVALAVLLTTFPAFRTELRFFGGSCGLAKKCRGKKVGQ